MSVLFVDESETVLPFSAERLIRDVIDCSLHYLNCPYKAQVSVTLSSDAAIRELNNSFRSIDSATDVLSFPMIPFTTPNDLQVVKDDPGMYFDPETDELVLGDIVISTEHAIRQATEYNHSVKREIGFLTAHSMLHLFGYDHMNDTDRMIMEKAQEEILEQIGLTRNCE